MKITVLKDAQIAANTDAKSLKGCGRKVIKFQFGQNLTHGLGTGMNPELGKLAAQNEKEKIKKLLEGYDLCILVASLGGGTGSGAVSTFAKISKNLGNLTYGIFTLPFKFEREKKMEIAMGVLKEARGYFNAITVIPNERVFQIINKDTPIKEALSAINKFLSESLGGLIETIYKPGLINIDFADFKTVLKGRGRLAYLNTIESQMKEVFDRIRSAFFGIILLLSFLLILNTINLDGRFFGICFRLGGLRFQSLLSVYLVIMQPPFQRSFAVGTYLGDVRNTYFFIKDGQYPS